MLRYGLGILGAAWLGGLAFAGTPVIEGPCQDGMRWRAAPLQSEQIGVFYQACDPAIKQVSLTIICRPGDGLVRMRLGVLTTGMPAADSVGVFRVGDATFAVQTSSRLSKRLGGTLIDMQTDLADPALAALGDGLAAVLTIGDVRYQMHLRGSGGVLAALDGCR